MKAGGRLSYGMKRGIVVVHRVASPTISWFAFDWCFVADFITSLAPSNKKEKGMNNKTKEKKTSRRWVAVERKRVYVQQK